MLTLEHLSDLADSFSEDLTSRVKEFEIGGRPFAFNSKPSLMGVINLSPESWYRESVCLTTENAIERARILTAQGADLIDLGAESTLPHAARADQDAQLAHLLPILEAFKGEETLFSVETYNPLVAESCLRAGASVLNVTGAGASEKLYSLAAAHQAAVIICYVQGDNPREVDQLKFEDGQDPVAVMLEYFSRQLELAGRCGLEKIILDPGLGFYYRNLQDSAQRIRYQMRTFLNSFRLRKLGFPVCHALPHAFEVFGAEVRAAEPFFAVLAALGKTDLFRTHEIPRVKAVLETLGTYQS